MSKAYRLYERSLELAHGAVECAQPAIRIARMLIDPKNPSYGVKPDPLRALALFQQAEIGLRIDIADGQVYYAKRLAIRAVSQSSPKILSSRRPAPRRCSCSAAARTAGPNG